MPTKPQDHQSKTVVTPNGAHSLIEIVTDPFDTPPDAIPLFSIDGVTYSMPGEVSAATSLKALDLARRSGMESAVSWILEEVLGLEAYTALLNCKALKASQLAAIMEVVEKHTLGAMEASTGN